MAGSLKALAVLGILLVAAPPASGQGYGSDAGWRLVFHQDEASGLAGGVQVYALQHGRLRLTWKRRAELTTLASVRGGLGADLVLGQRLGRSRAAFVVQGTLKRRLESYRFYGYGNDRPLVDPQRALVPLDERSAEARLELSLASSGTMSIGTRVARLDPHPDPGSPLLRSGAPDAGTFRKAGLLAAVDLPRVDDVLFPRSGVRLLAHGATYWPSEDGASRFSTLDVDLRSYLPLPLGAVLAARALGRAVDGRAPVHEAAFLGGAESLRGYAPQRFAGDASAAGSVELRMPLVSVPFLLRGRVGALAFADGGRVYLDRSTPGGLHRSSGGGLWYETSRGTITALYGNGEEHLVHLYLGMPF